MFRMLSDEALSCLEGMTKFQTKTMNVLIKYANVKDNCVQESMTEICRREDLDKGYVSRAVAYLVKINLVKKNVVDIFDKKRLMINPKMVWSTNRELIHFAANMYHLGSHQEAWSVAKLEKEVVGKVDAETGELYSEYQHRLGELLEYRQLMEDNQ